MQTLCYGRLISDYNRDFIRDGFWIAPPFHHNQDEIEVADYCLKLHNTLVALEGFNLPVAALSILVCNETNKRITIHSEEIFLGTSYMNPIIFHPEKSSGDSFFTYDIDLSAPSFGYHLERFCKYFRRELDHLLGLDSLCLDNIGFEKIQNFNVDARDKEIFTVYIPLKMVTAFATAEMA